MVRLQMRDDVEVHGSERVVVVADVDAALEEVRRFLDRLAADDNSLDAGSRAPEP